MPIVDERWAVSEFRTWIQERLSSDIMGMSKFKSLAMPSSMDVREYSKARGRRAAWEKINQHAADQVSELKRWAQELRQTPPELEDRDLDALQQGWLEALDEIIGRPTKVV